MEAEWDTGLPSEGRESINSCRVRFGTHAQNSLPFRSGGGSGGSEGRGQWREERGWKAPGPGLGPWGSPGQHARLWSSKSRFLQPASGTDSGGPDFRGVSPPNGIHRWIRTRGVRNHFISTQASDTGFGAAWDRHRRGIDEERRNGDDEDDGRGTLRRIEEDLGPSVMLAMSDQEDRW